MLASCELIVVQRHYVYNANSLFFFLQFAFFLPIRFFFVIGKPFLAVGLVWLIYIYSVCNELMYICFRYTIYCVLILLYMCPDTVVYVSSYFLYTCPHATIYVCPHTTICMYIYVADSLFFFCQFARDIYVCVHICRYTYMLHANSFFFYL